MRFTYGKTDWSSQERGEENSYLLTNGLGGFSSQSIIGSNARNDQAVLMACTVAPVERYHMVTRIEEEVEMTGEEESKRVSLSAQRYADHSREQSGQKYLQSFVFEDFPVWIYQVGGLQIRKSMVMKYGENTVGLQYRLTNRGQKTMRLLLTPYLQFMPKTERMPEGKPFYIQLDRIRSHWKGTIQDGIRCLYFWTNGEGEVEPFETRYETQLYYAHDNRDGRPDTGCAAANHRIVLNAAPKEEAVFELIYGMGCEKQIESYRVDRLLAKERRRKKALTSCSGLRSETAGQLVKAADQFVVERASTGGKSIIAGYPFFGDWGRDTMIALPGCCLATGRASDARSILGTFARYCRRGIMPNMFPEGMEEPLYNTADASLLFLSAVYAYYCRTKDLDFVRECWDTMVSILDWYQNGTDFHIRMDEDGLIEAGGDMEQVTWMDVRFEDILPTPRHGKPVEINAYWHNGLCAMERMAQALGSAEPKKRQQYQKTAVHCQKLAQQVRKSFREKYWNPKTGCLRDVLVKEEPELSQKEQQRRKRAQDQIRCNQIWAVSQPFPILERQQEKAVVDKVFELLYTPVGLRSLSPDDPEYQARYMGDWKHRDLAYHQGTIWGFPLGAYYLAYLKVHDYSRDAKKTVQDQLTGLESALREGCVGQLPEIYDAEIPTVSEGCFAQAWSVGELLLVYEALEKGPVLFHTGE